MNLIFDLYFTRIPWVDYRAWFIVGRGWSLRLSGGIVTAFPVFGDSKRTTSERATVNTTPSKKRF